MFLAFPRASWQMAKTCNSSLTTLGVALCFSFLAICHPLPVFAASHGFSRHDASTPTSPSCNKKFQLVKIKNWANEVESTIITGLSAKFGASLPSHEGEAERLPAVLANPLNCCANSSSKLSNSIALAKRGDCMFTTKAQIAQTGGARGLLIINDDEELYKMVCTKNDTSLDLKIPVVMIPKSAGKKIQGFMSSGVQVEVLLFSPDRPVIDVSAIFLWLMAVGTIVSSSLWSEFITCEQVDERYNHLTRKETSDAENIEIEESNNEILEINVKGAVIFIIMASVFLMLLYFFMSSWFIWLLIVLFCIGGAEGMHACLVALISRIFRDASRMTVHIPIFDDVSILSIVILSFCAAFAIFWAANQHAPFAWIGQDILVLDSAMPFYRDFPGISRLNPENHGIRNFHRVSN